MLSGTMSIIAGRSWAERAAGLLLLILPLSHTAALAQPTPDRSLLPFTTTDAIVRRNLITGQLVRTTGVIEDLTGDVVQLRRSGARVERIRLRDITELQFRRSPEYEDGLSQLQRRDYGKALTAFEAARSVEPRGWVICEIRASSARALLGLRRYPDVIQQIEEIVRLDAETRHVVLLPLVWDERLPVEERYQARPDELTAASPLKQLTAASALLQVPEHEARAVDVLTQLRTSGRGFVPELAELQLWRTRLLHSERLRKADTSFWQDRVRDFDGELRGVAEFLLGRGLMTQHDYDGAALSLMWMPLMSPHDPPLAAASLQDATIALQNAGRSSEAARLLAELTAGFPQTSIVRNMQKAGPED